MTSNPFAPPLAPVEDPSHDPSAPARRPISVLTFQAVAGLGASAVAVRTVATVWQLPSGVFREVGVVAGLSVLVTLLGMLVVTIVGCQRRARFARWAGLAFIALIFGLCAWAVVAMLGIPSAVEDEDSRSAGDVVILVAGVLMLVPTAFWFWAYGFSAKSRAWFGSRGAHAQSTP